MLTESLENVIYLLLLFSRININNLKKCEQNKWILANNLISLVYIFNDFNLNTISISSSFANNRRNKTHDYSSIY